MKLYLGGVDNKSSWKVNLLAKLFKEVSPTDNLYDVFNTEGAVYNDTEEKFREQSKHKDYADYCIYAITPRWTSVSLLAEVIDESNKRPDKTILCVLQEDISGVPISKRRFEPIQMPELLEASEYVQGNGGKVFRSIDDIVSYLVESTCEEHQELEVCPETRLRVSIRSPSGFGVCYAEIEVQDWESFDEILGKDDVVKNFLVDSEHFKWDFNVINKTNNKPKR